MEESPVLRISLKNVLRLFLVACTRLYNPLCLSIGRSVGWLVGHVLLFFMILFSNLTAPAQMV